MFASATLTTAGEQVWLCASANLCLATPQDGSANYIVRQNNSLTSPLFPCLAPPRPPPALLPRLEPPVTTEASRPVQLPSLLPRLAPAAANGKGEADGRSKNGVVATAGDSRCYRAGTAPHAQARVVLDVGSHNLMPLVQPHFCKWIPRPSMVRS